MLDISRIAPNCALAPDGIWYAPGMEALSYPSEGNGACFELEDSSFWFEHRSACIEAAVRTFPPPQGEPIFDVGGGNGFVSLGLMKAGFEVVVVEPGRAGAMNARRRGIPTVVCATTGGFLNASIGAVGLFDVVEHVRDDVEFLRSTRSLLKRGGRLYATVPAYGALWSDEDVRAGHFRRYTLGSIRDSVERAGLRVDYATYIFRPLPLPILLLRALPYRLNRASPAERNTRNAAVHHSLRPSLARRALLSVLSSEVRSIRRRQHMRFGGSCLLVATAA